MNGNVNVNRGRKYKFHVTVTTEFVTDNKVAQLIAAIQRLSPGGSTMQVEAQEEGDGKTMQRRLRATRLGNAWLKSGRE